MIRINDEMDNSIVPIEPCSNVEVDRMQDIPESTDATDGADMRIVPEDTEDSSEDSTIDLSDPRYIEIMKRLISNGYTESKFLGTSGYLVAPQNDNDAKLICPSLKDGFQVKYGQGSIKVFPSGYFAVKNLADDLNLVLSGATTDETKDRHVNESYDHKTTYTLEVNDPDGTIKDLLDYIKELSDRGHSFPVMVDSESDDRHMKFFIDGDGSDRIISIKSMNENYDDTNYENLEIAYIDARTLRDNQGFYDPHYILMKAKMLLSVVDKFIKSDYPNSDGSEHAMEIVEICNQLLLKYKEDDQNA